MAFLIDSSLTFDDALRRAGVELPPEVWVLRTDLETRPAGRLSGRLIVTLRYFTPAEAIIATTTNGPLPRGITGLRSISATQPPSVQTLPILSSEPEWTNCPPARPPCFGPVV